MRIKIMVAMLLAACVAQAAATYEETEAKCKRFYDNKEWASASAMLNFMLHERPEVPSTYGRAIVAASMQDDSARSMQLLSDAMKYGVPLDSVLSHVKNYSFELDQPNLYENFMLASAKEYPWLSRPLDMALLKYYTFRRNGPQMVARANKMLAASPDNCKLLDVLAQGYLIEGNNQAAAAAWQKMAKVDPSNMQALLYLGNYYYMSGEKALALPYLQKAMAIKPTPYLAGLIREIKQPQRK